MFKESIAEHHEMDKVKIEKELHKVERELHSHSRSVTKIFKIGF